MQELLLMISPIVVALITQGTKHVSGRLTNIRNADGLRQTVFRLVAAVLSFASVMVAASLSGGEVDAASIDVLSQAVVTFFGATGLYFLTKKKK